MHLKILLVLLLTAFPFAAQAQDALPEIPAPIQTMVDRGAQIRYLGKSNGLDGWITIFKGQEQYFYVFPDGRAFVMGLLFDETGKSITIRQVQELQRQGDKVLDMLASGEVSSEGIDLPPDQELENPFIFKKPSERMFDDIQTSNWVNIGDRNAPAIYTFIDPQCPHCHEFISDLREDYIETGLIQVRMIPVGFRKETLAQAAFLLAAPDAKDHFYRQLDGEEGAIPADYDLSNQGVQKNLAIMQQWKFDVTPMTIYENKVGEVKIIRGRANNPEALLSDLR
ncbi:MAG: thioredoxin domain-containing protein [Pseudomonadota bacterium]